MRRLAAFALVLAVAATVAAAATAGGGSAQTLSSAIQSAVDAKHSVHYVSKNEGGGRSVLIVADVGHGIGVQRVVFVAGKAGSGTILVVHRTAYIRGDVLTMEGYFGFKKAQATKYAGKWISIPHADKLFSPTVADATFSSFASDLLPNRKLSVVHSTVGGTKVQGVRGIAKQDGVSFTETVYAPESGRPLPVEEKASSKVPVAETSRVTMSNWNEELHVKAPAHAVPIATVRHGGGGGGGPVA